MYTKIHYFIALSLFLVGTVAGQDVKNNKGYFFLEPELMFGTVVANYSEFPESDSRKSFSLNIGRLKAIPNLQWTHYYSYPTTGIGFSYSDFSNREVLGSEISIIPYLLINLSKKRFRSWYLKFGLGASHFTKYYHGTENPTNEVIGSKFTWAFQAFLYRSLFVTEKMHVKLGAGYWHSSNGHTTLPNFGMNSMMVTLATQFFTQPVNRRFYEDNHFQIDKTKHFFLNFRTGLGVHELGGARGPTEGPKKNVYTIAFGGAMLLKNHFRINTGFAYRFYQHYYDQITDNNFSEFSDHPVWNASNIGFYLGVEWLIGHVGMEVAGGLNIYKPFFEKHFREFDVSENDTEYWLKRLFSTRMGLNFYLFNTNKLPENNVYIGAHINANFGQADFSEISLGFVRMIK
ncbi:acyloxyacyl hydrolase [Fulvivirgaceae bacterium BMA12]|uniref:Acyloxyacyl hydrolase n=1 Tax=Agaribacillus aureus TaxID=3051825 RepID=A0ABT8L3X5_9BACT|nr:acyloxyacyl hydrolase [Fulvivirgaceae bacterium BMA12]